jgi:hypothetical protein
MERPNERQKQKQQFRYNLTTCLSSESFAAKLLLNYSSEIRAICLPLVFPINFKLFSFQCQAPDGTVVLQEDSWCNNNTCKPVTRIKGQKKRLWHEFPDAVKTINSKEMPEHNIRVCGRIYSYPIPSSDTFWYL